MATPTLGKKPARPLGDKKVYVLITGSVKSEDIVGVATNPGEGMKQMDAYQKSHPGQAVSFVSFTLPRGAPRAKSA